MQNLCWVVVIVGQSPQVSLAYYEPVGGHFYPDLFAAYIFSMGDPSGSGTASLADLLMGK